MGSNGRSVFQTELPRPRMRPNSLDVTEDIMFVSYQVATREGDSGPPPPGVRQLTFIDLRGPDAFRAANSNPEHPDRAHPGCIDVGRATYSAARWAAPTPSKPTYVAGAGSPRLGSGRQPVPSGHRDPKRRCQARRDERTTCTAVGPTCPRIAGFPARQPRLAVAWGGFPRRLQRPPRDRTGGAMRPTVRA